MGRVSELAGPIGRPVEATEPVEFVAAAAVFALVWYHLPFSAGFQPVVVEFQLAVVFAEFVGDLPVLERWPVQWPAVVRLQLSAVVAVGSVLSVEFFEKIGWLFAVSNFHLPVWHGQPALPVPLRH